MPFTTIIHWPDVIAGTLLGVLTTLVFALRASRDAMRQHLEQLEQMRTQHQREIDMAWLDHREIKRFVQTILQRTAPPGSFAVDSQGLPTGRTLTDGTLASSLGGVSGAFTGSSAPPD